MMVATQSRFHRDMPDGEQIALKPLSFCLVPNLQVVTLARLRLILGAAAVSWIDAAATWRMHQIDGQVTGT